MSKKSDKKVIKEDAVKVVEETVIETVNIKDAKAEPLIKLDLKLIVKLVNKIGKVIINESSILAYGEKDGKIHVKLKNGKDLVI